MAKLMIYQKPTCSTCRGTIKLVEASGLPYETINYYERPFTRTALKKLLKKVGLTARELLRTKEEIYKTLGLAKKRPTEDELIDLMIQHPDLIQRPIVEKDEQAILARPAESVKRLL